MTCNLLYKYINLLKIKFKFVLLNVILSVKEFLLDYFGTGNGRCDFSITIGSGMIVDNRSK